VTDGESLSAAASHRHDYLRISCRNAAINVVVCRAVSQQAAAADELRQSSAVCVPVLAHLSPHKTSMRRNVTTAQLVVKGEQAAITESLNSSEAPSVSSHAVL